MVGRALFVTLGLALVTTTARAEKPRPAEPEPRATEIIDPYAEPEPRVVEVVDPYAEPEQPAVQLDLERVCENYCLARGDTAQDRTPQLPRRLPPPKLAEPWGLQPEETLESPALINKQQLGGFVLGLSALGATALFAAVSADDNGGDFSGLTMLGGMGVGAGLVLGVALIVDGADGKTEVQVAGLSR